MCLTRRASTNSSAVRTRRAISLIPTISIFAIETAASMVLPLMTSGAGLDAGTNPSRVWLVVATGNYFDALRVEPYLGRFFHASDEHGPNSAPYIVLSYEYWHTHFQDDRGVV